MFSQVSCIEPLEARIAPASIVFHSDADPSKTVTLSSNVGTAADLMSLATVVGGHGLYFPSSELDLVLAVAGHAKFNHADFSVTTANGAAVIVHSFDATGLDLGHVTVRGDVDQILAGDRNLATPAVKSLDVDTLGQRSQAVSVIHGSITQLHIAQALYGTLTLETKAGSLGSAIIDGNLEGGSSNADGAGSIFAGGSIGSLQINGSLVGGVGAKSGSVFAAGSILGLSAATLAGGIGAFSGSVHADGNIPYLSLGSLTGSTDSSSQPSNGSITAYGALGLIYADKLTGGFAAESGSIGAGGGIGAAEFVGSIAGGDGFESGSIGAHGPIGRVTIGAGAVLNTSVPRMTGGDGEKSGSILGSTSIGRVTVLGDIVGGNGAHSAEIASAGTLGRVDLGGDLRGGNLGVGSGAIGSTGALGDVSVTGNVIGGLAPSSGQIVSATSIHSVSVYRALEGGLGSESGAIGSLGAIGSVYVNHDVLGGGSYHSGSIVSAQAIGKVTIGGGLIGGGPFETPGQDAVVLAGRSIGSITVGADVQGGNRAGSGVIEAGALPSVTIHGNIIGGGGEGSGAVRGLASVGRVTVDGDVRAGTADESGVISSQASIRSVTIGGSLDGSTSGPDGAFSGAILAETPEGLSAGNPGRPGLPGGVHRIGAVSIGGSIIGGAAVGAGSIFALGDIQHVTVGAAAVTTPPQGAEPTTAVESGDLLGGTGGLTGVIFSNGVGSTIGDVVVNGSILGRLGPQAGGIAVPLGHLGTVHVVSDVIGGDNFENGFIVGGSIAEVHIGGNLTGGGLYNDEQSNDSGLIVAVQGSLGKLVVGGEIGASPVGAGAVISAFTNIGSIDAGSIAGRTTSPVGPTTDYDVEITAGGNPGARTAAEAIAIGSVTVHTAMSYTTIWAGTTGARDFTNGHVSIGAIEVGQPVHAAGQAPIVWTANQIIAGATGDTLNDTDGSDGNPALLSQVGKIIIHGEMGATPDESYAVIADHIGSVTANGVALKLTPGARNDLTGYDFAIDPSGTTVFYEIGARRT